MISAWGEPAVLHSLRLGHGLGSGEKAEVWLLCGFIDWMPRPEAAALPQRPAPLCLCLPWRRGEDDQPPCPETGATLDNADQGISESDFVKPGGGAGTVDGPGFTTRVGLPPVRQLVKRARGFIFM